MLKYETIDELLNAPEGEHFEFKEAKMRFDFGEACRYCCALSNWGGGKFILGITDKRPRKVVGSKAFDQPERTRKGLMDKLHIRVEFEVLEYEGKRILVFDIAGRPSGLPVQVDGIAWWRDGDSLVPMPEDIRHRIYDETGHDFSGDICLGAGLKDLDEKAVETFRNLWMEKSENRRIKNLSTKQLMLDCGALTEKGLTYAALILFGKSASLRERLPQTEIIFEYRSNEASGPAAQREEFRIGFFAIYDRIWELINLRNDKQHYQDGFVILDIPTFNERVVREALLNAVSHRNYNYAGSIFVRQYRNRLIIESPGGLPPEITFENILNRQSPRNRLIAEIFALSGLVERSGQGMNLIYEYSVREAKELPEFKGSDAYFVNLTLNGRVLDDKLPTLMRKIGDERLESFTTDDFLVIYSLFFNMRLSDNQLQRVQNLIDMGVLEQTSSGEIIISRDLYEPSVKIVPSPQIKVDLSDNKKRILMLIKKNGAFGTPLKDLQQLFPGYSRGQVQVLLRSLQKDELIYCEGKGGAAKWFLSL